MDDNQWVLCVSCFDRSWDIELSRAGEAMVTIRPTNYQAAGCCGHWIPAHCPRCWVTLSPGHHWLHHGSFLGNSGQHGQWRLCLDPANISDIYQTGNFNENKNMGAIGNWNWSDFLVLVDFNAGESYDDSNQNASFIVSDWAFYRVENTLQRFRHWTLRFTNMISTAGSMNLKS